MRACDTRDGYSNVVQFSNPGGGKSREYQGVGFQIDDVAGERLTPVVVARNVGDVAATVRARVPYTRADDTTGVVELPQTRLRAGEMRLLDTQQVTQRNRQEQIQIAGLEVEYDAAPGSVLVNAHSVSASGNQVFRVPMWDPLGQRSPTGGYPWRIEGTSTTRTYIKVTPGDVSFNNLSFYEGSCPMVSSGWLATFNDPHPMSQSSSRIASDNSVDRPDEIFSGVKNGPYGVGEWYWDIPWNVITNSKQTHHVRDHQAEGDLRQRRHGGDVKGRPRGVQSP